jgi:phosphoribosylaminoimidazolecarboxamide formyltransferase/IMP cyclohydrolase
MRALVSTSDKNGLVEFLKPLVEQGLKIVSTGGTLSYLTENQIIAEEVTALTGFPEVLDGRVKTLHPNVHMGLLADRQNKQHLDQLNKFGVQAFDLVVGNLYPFENAAENKNASENELIENIDVGGPAFLRASAKNFRSVIVVCDPGDYDWLKEKILSDSVTLADRKKLAIKVFSLTSYYDALIVNRLADDSTNYLKYLNIPLKKKADLRYGENPHQMASWFENPLSTDSLSRADHLQGKELSYNNLLDLDAAFSLVQQFHEPACVVVKHNNPCGVACGDSIVQASHLAVQADPKSIFGGIVALNRTLDANCLNVFENIFLECIIAPSLSQDVKPIIQKKKNLRVLTLKNFTNEKKFYKSVSGGCLIQTADIVDTTNWKFFGKQPDETLLKSLRFAEVVAAALKSNAIAIVHKTQTVGLGMGQVNRVDAVTQAVERMHNFSKSSGHFDYSRVVLASDAFFPFPDSIEVIAKSGIQWILQPGGSIQDEKVILAAKKYGINMVLTQQRHFRH